MQLLSYFQRLKARKEIAMLSGYKTYIAAFLMILVGGLYQQGYIDETTFKSLEAILLGGGLAALRAGVKKGGGS